MRLAARRAMSPLELAEELGKDPSQISRQLRELEKFGFAEDAKRTKWDHPRETTRGSALKQMRKPVQTTVEGLVYVILHDLASQLELGRKIERLTFSRYLIRYLEDRIEEHPEKCLSNCNNQ